MKALFICCLLAGIHISSFSQQAAVLNKPKYEKAAQALGFLEGQELQLVRIQQDFPELSGHVQLARSEFSSAFGQANHHIVHYLKDYYGDHYTTFEQSLQKGLRATSDQMRIKDRTSAETYIAEVKKRSVGEISAPVLEILLAYQYLAFPAEEFSAGMTNTFRTKGHVKAKDTDWQLSLPKSWAAREGMRPNIIQVFISENGHGMEGVMLMVRDLPMGKNEKLSQKDLLGLFSEQGQRRFIPSDQKFISSKKVTIDNQPGAMLESETVTERVDIQVKTRMLQFCFYRAEKLYFVQCFVSGQKDENLEPRYGKFFPLFRMIANSIVINAAYR